jgi:hypothetical protein
MSLAKSALGKTVLGLIIYDIATQYYQGIVKLGGRI